MLNRIIVTILVGFFMWVTLVTPVEAQTGLTWSAEYFNNAFLQGPSIARNYVGSVNFNWGTGAGATNGPVDNWSARFGTNAPFSAGTYRFTITADDGVHLYVNGQLLIDTYSSPRSGQTLTADVTLPAGNFNVQVDYVEMTGNAFLNVGWQPINGTTPPVTQPTPVQGAWRAEYYNNRNLSGVAQIVTSENSPNHDWGNGSPANGIAVDQFSVRWSTSQNFNAGTYQVVVTADDGVRVYVNGVLVINEWHGAPTIATYYGTVNLGNGINTIIIEYYEEVGIAKLNFALNPQGTGTTNPPPANNTGAVAVINTSALNVRSTPFVADNVITRVYRGGQYTIIGRTGDNAWYQIQLNAGSTGWVSARYITASNTGQVPVVNVQVSVPDAPASTGYVARATANVNMRGGAGTTFSRIGILPINANATILARNAQSTWWLVSYGGVNGWVNGSYLALPSGMDYNRISVR